MRMMCMVHGESMSMTVNMNMIMIVLVFMILTMSWLWLVTRHQQHGNHTVVYHWHVLVDPSPVALPTNDVDHVTQADDYSTIIFAALTTPMGPGLGRIFLWSTQKLGQLFEYLFDRCLIPMIFILPQKKWDDVYHEPQSCLGFMGWWLPSGNST